MAIQQRKRGVAWLDRNLTRAYPLDDTSHRNSVNGQLRLANDLLSSLYLHVLPFGGLDTAGFYLRRVTIASDMIFAQLGYSPRDSELISVVAEGEVVRYSDQHQFFELPTVGEWAGNKVYGLIGRWPDLTVSPAGTYNFNPDATRLASDCVRVTTPRVSSFRARSGAQVSPKVSGKVRFQASPSVRLWSEEIESGIRSIRVDAIPPQTVSGSLGYPLRQINNVGPAADGNLNFVGLKCTEVEPGDGLVDLRNTCGDPCCGCDEIHGLVDELKDGLKMSDNLEQRLSSVKDHLDSLAITNAT